MPHYRHSNISMSIPLGDNLWGMADGLGKRVRERRKALRLTQVQLSKLAGIGQSAISAIENDETGEMLSGTLLSLATALETTPEWLKTGIEAAQEPSPPPYGGQWPDLTAENVRRLLAIAHALVLEQTRKPSAADPFPNAPKPRPVAKKPTR